MLTVYRGNRAELLAELLATQLRLDPPGPFETLEVVVNTWPTSRWLGEQLAVGLGGIAANIRFPFPGAQMRRWVAALLDEGAALNDPWRASDLVWPVLEELETLIALPEAVPLRQWLERREAVPGRLDLALWQLGRAIADAFDDVALYRPDVLAAWWQGDGEGWQPRLLGLLRQRLPLEPFGLRALRAIARLQQGPPPPGLLPSRLRLFGLSAMAPVQVQLLQALSAHQPVDLYLLTPCRDLWRRCGSRRRQLSDALALQSPLDGAWLLEAPGLEARFGRLGAEFQQLLEGSGETLLGQSQERDLFFAPATVWTARQSGPPPLLAQLQQQLADPDQPLVLQRAAADASLEFHPCPGRLRQVQIVRDRVLQLLAADPSLQPRDVLVMTPQVDAFAPLVASVFGDQEATGVSLPWRLTDRSQQGEADLSATLLQLLNLAGERLTATALEALLERPCLGTAFGLERTAIGRLNQLLQQAGFRWGLDAGERGGAASDPAPAGSLAWACDRLLLGLVLPGDPGLAPADTAPLAAGLDLETLGRCLHLLGRLRHWLAQLRQDRSSAAWAAVLRSLLADLFGEAAAAVPEQAWELPQLLAALDAWQQAAGDCDLQLAAPVVAAVLQERLAVDSGRFGHRSGALTVSALEPMRAIPHRVIVLMGLDAGCFPRQSQRPGFHLLEQQRRLGDPNPADQDRYVLLEALLSARDHLLISWSSRDERSGEALPPATPVRQWLAWLQAQLPCGGSALVADHAANPLQASNFEAGSERPAASCDRRALRARCLLDAPDAVAPPQPLAFTPPPEPPPERQDRAASDLGDWLVAPQRCWLRELGLDPREWSELIVDLEASALEERERSALLREALALPSETVDWGEPQTWLEHCRGRGLLPAAAAALLEADTLASRWRELQALLEPLGPARAQQLSWQGWLQPLQWRGQTLVLLQPARDQSRHHLALWWQLLLAAAAGLEPAAALLLARGDKGYAVQGRFAPPSCGAAQAELQRLADLRQRWRGRCWPVPPRSGWALLSSGKAQAITVWDGNPQLAGERQDPEQALCFGAELSGQTLWGGDAGEQRRQLAAELLEPLLQQRR